MINLKDCVICPEKDRQEYTWYDKTPETLQIGKADNEVRDEICTDYKVPRAFLCVLAPSTNHCEN